MFDSHFPLNEETGLGRRMTDSLARMKGGLRYLLPSLVGSLSMLGAVV